VAKEGLSEKMVPPQPNKERHGNDNLFILGVLVGSGNSTPPSASAHDSEESPALGNRHYAEVFDRGNVDVLNSHGIGPNNRAYHVDKAMSTSVIWIPLALVAFVLLVHSVVWLSVWAFHMWQHFVGRRFLETQEVFLGLTLEEVEALKVACAPCLIGEVYLRWNVGGSRDLPYEIMAVGDMPPRDKGVVVEDTILGQTLWVAPTSKVSSQYHHDLGKKLMERVMGLVAMRHHKKQK
jgi:hypothetical protein